MAHENNSFVDLCTPYNSVGCVTAGEYTVYTV